MNYLEGKCKDTSTVNGSILLDFSSTVTSPLDASLLTDPVTAFSITDDKEWVISSVDETDAYAAGGKSVPGTINDNSSNNNLLTTMLAVPNLLGASRALASMPEDDLAQEEDLTPENDTAVEEDQVLQENQESEADTQEANLEADESDNAIEENDSTIEENVNIDSPSNVIIPSIIVSNDNQDGQESNSGEDSDDMEFDALPAESSDDGSVSDDVAEPDEPDT